MITVEDGDIVLCTEIMTALLCFKYMGHVGILDLLFIHVGLLVRDCFHILHTGDSGNYFQRQHF